MSRVRVRDFGMSVRRLFVAVASAAVLGACGKSIDVAEWTEEVKLHDQRMVTVWRKARAYSGGFPNSRRGRDIDFELKYAPMNVEWKATLSNTFIRRPISFEIFDGVPHLVLFIGDSASCANRPKTDYSAQFLRWSDGHWVEVSQADFPIDKALMNLSPSFWGHTTRDDYKGFVRWDEKELANNAVQVRPESVKSYVEGGNRFCSRFVD